LNVAQRGPFASLKADRVPLSNCTRVRYCSFRALGNSRGRVLLVSQGLRPSNDRVMHRNMLFTLGQRLLATLQLVVRGAVASGNCGLRAIPISRTSNARVGRHADHAMTDQANPREDSAALARGTSSDAAGGVAHAPVHKLMLHRFRILGYELALAT
jgi:hypothetical protein